MGFMKLPSDIVIISQLCSLSETWVKISWRDWADFLVLQFIYLFIDQLPPIIHSITIEICRGIRFVKCFAAKSKLGILMESRFVQHKSHYIYNIHFLLVKTKFKRDWYCIFLCLANTFSRKKI